MGQGTQRKNLDHVRVEFVVSEEDILAGDYEDVPDSPTDDYAIFCIHCKTRKGQRVRRLCHSCYCDQAIRALYPINKTTVGFGGRQDFNGQPRRPSKPTRYIPGTEAKIRVMQLRASRGESVFHPDDVRCRLD